jgi:type VI protein secretion system component VasK
MTESPAYVKRESCSRRHRFLVTTYLAGVTLILFIVGWAVTKGYTAEKQAGEVDTRLQVHEKGQERDEQHLRETLGRLEEMQKRVFDKVVNGK